MTRAHLLFASTHLALWAEKVLHERGLVAKVVSVPRELSSDCGYCVRIDATDVEAARAALDEVGVDYDRVATG